MELNRNEDRDVDAEKRADNQEPRIGTALIPDGTI